MAIVGHWSSLSEAQKLVQDVLLAGVVEEIIEEGQLLSMLPVFSIDGKTVKYNRESSLPSAAFYDIGEQLVWTADVNYTAQVTAELKRVARQDVLDKFMAQTYKNPNDYRSIVISELRKGCMRTIEDKILYGDSVNVSAKEFDGLHYLVAAQTGDLNIDEGEGPLSLMNIRKMLDAMKISAVGKAKTILLMPKEIARRIDAYVQEAGLASWVGPASIVFAPNELGQRVTWFDGIPIIRSDYLVAEQVNTGLTQATARAKYSSGTKQYSIFCVRFGQILEGGVSMGFGGEDGGGGAGDFFRMEFFDKLEDYDAEGIRLVAYCCLALGATLSLARIADVTDAAVTAS